MKECIFICNFVNDNNLEQINDLYNCNCEFCKNYNDNFINFKNKIYNLDKIINVKLENNINLIWTQSMIFIKKYIMLFEKNFYI